MTMMRTYVQEDLSDILQVCRQGLSQHVQAHFTHPYRHIYPDAFHEAMDAVVTKKASGSDPTGFNLVIEDERGRVVAWAFWRKNDGEHYQEKIAEYRRIVNGSIVDRSVPSISRKKDNDEKPTSPSASVARIQMSEKCVVNDTLRYFPEPHWYLSQIMVDPSQKRKGLGTMLALWGMRRAKEDKLPCYLTASPEGEMLYTRLGWRKIGERSFPKLEDMDEEDRKKEQQDFGEEEMVRHFSMIPPSVMSWGDQETDYAIFEQYKDLLQALVP